MPYLLLYLIKLSLTLAVLYVFYAAFLKNLTFYTWNRFYLLFYSLGAFFIPFINITPWIEEQPAGPAITRQVNFISRLPTIAAISDHPASLSAWQLLCALFVSGLLVMLTRLAVQLLTIRSIRRSAMLIRANGICFYDVDSPISPFSFAQSIFVNTRLHSTEELQKIIEHEFVHVKQKHTIDLLAAELLCIVSWFNPFAWLIKKAIRQNLEFIADNSVLQTGFDAKHYQYLLLKVTGMQSYSVSNNFNISSLKKRIFMMNKIRSARVHLLKFLFVLPLLALILVSFREQQVKRQADAIRQKSSRMMYDTVPPPPPPTVTPPPPPPMPPVVSGKHHKPVPPPFPKDVISITIGKDATVLLKSGKTEVYHLDNPAEQKAYEKKYALLPPPPPPPPVPTQGMPGISDNGNDSLTVLVEKAVDEKEVAKWEAEKAANEKEKAKWKAEKAAWEKERAANGKEKALWEKEKAASKKKNGTVSSPPPFQDIIVTGKKKALNDEKPLPPLSSSKPVTHVEEPAGLTITADTIYTFNSPDAKGRVSISKTYAAADTPDLLYVVNGVVRDKAYLNSIDTKQIESIEILKNDNSVVQQYGDKARNGVIIITLKDDVAQVALKAETFNVPEHLYSLADFKGIIIINGKEASKAEVEKTVSSLQKDLLNFNVELSTLKRDEAIRKYGDRAIDGVIAVTYRKLK